MAARGLSRVRRGSQHAQRGSARCGAVDHAVLPVLSLSMIHGFVTKSPLPKPYKNLKPTRSPTNRIVNDACPPRSGRSGRAKIVPDLDRRCHRGPRLLNRQRFVRGRWPECNRVGSSYRGRRGRSPILPGGTILVSQLRATVFSAVPVSAWKAGTVVALPTVAGFPVTPDIGTARSPRLPDLRQEHRLKAVAASNNCRETQSFRHDGAAERLRPRGERQ